ncbi:MAG: MOSC domain-containing protein [Acidimicrobiia bacterium]|nr:MOSC domain-containing protein [Acidimicrobiia bacterium]
MELVSIQIASAPSPIQIGTRTDQTGIFKTPVAEAVLTDSGVVGDTIADERHHGGPDQAVYVYSAEDYAWWAAELMHELPPGQFGENLTLSTFGEGTVRIGDRYTIGDAVIEVTAPRIPCNTFQAKMQRPGWIEAFRHARRPGFYARVIAEGTVRPGMAVTRNPAPETNLGLVEMQDLYYQRPPDLDAVRRALESPVAERDRAEYLSLLERHAE